MRFATALLALSLIGCDDSGPTITIQAEGDPGHEIRAMVGEAARQVTVGIDRSKLMDLYRAGQYDAFVTEMEAFVARTGDPVDRYNLACGYALAGRPDQAIAQLTLLLDIGEPFNLESDSDFDSLRGRADFQALLSRAEQMRLADDVLEPIRDLAMERYEQDRFTEFTVMMEKVYEYSRNDTDLYNLACGYALAGQPDKALEALEALASRGGLSNASTDSDFDSLRGDPRFKALFRRG